MSTKAKARQLACILSCCFAAGCVGGIVNTLFPIILEQIGLVSSIVEIHPSFSKCDLYQKAFWGGIWGVAFLIRLGRVKNFYLQASIYGLLPSLTQLFIIFPQTTPFGIGGIGLGHAMPFLVVLFNTVGWSWPAYWWFKYIGPHGEDLDHHIHNSLLGSGESAHDMVT
ncbi:hypothetical protein DUNSADRAFT_5837 [Dunaliella salina]|uniref:Uncharacterized protein n=1 Tax=Dunaliella salina TaxID=3046 RepID=A0ABQ7GPI0_DUNSA|nr:hypothetical protein DUNSADRAFT_5837 [Dunaliella salina]|eukprot:KAF5836506.1 hypothetical protein DUNSADRAFT_5837 [Dunaliella salina]